MGRLTIKQLKEMEQKWEKEKQERGSQKITSRWKWFWDLFPLF